MAHSSCSNSSNISGNLNVRSITNSGARLLMTHDITGFSGGRVSNYIGDDGVTAGDAIRYDVVPYKADGVTDSPSYQKYRKAQADTAENAEIVGIVESIDNGIVSVILSGQMIYPDRIVNATHIDETLGTSGATGGNDIYFLSEVTAGAIQNLAPIEPTKIAKPILQQAADGTFSHHVVNYIGYQIGGSVVANLRGDDEDLGLKNYIDIGGGDMMLADNEWDATKKYNIAPLTTKSSVAKSRNNKTFNSLIGENGKLKNKPFGAEYCFEAAEGFVSSLWLNQKVYFIDGNGTRLWEGYCFQVGDTSRPNVNCIYVRTAETSEPAWSSHKLLSAKNERKTISLGEYCGVMLPTIPGKNTGIIGKGVDNTSVRITERSKITAKSDQGDDVVTVPTGNITVEGTFTAKGGLQAENSSYIVEDLAGTINTLATKLAALEQDMRGVGAETASITTNISSK
tara:strand:+ start:1172 stop:2536 length:1365 start_codon:yes stop_codon:yes gene_type:complete